MFTQEFEKTAKIKPIQFLLGVFGRGRRLKKHIDKDDPQPMPQNLQNPTR